MTKTWRLIAGLMCGGSVLGTVGAFAADSTGAEPVDFSVTLRAEHTDNRDASETDEESNNDFYVTPRISVYADTDRTRYDLYYAPSYRYRTDASDTQNDSEFLHDLGVRLTHRPSDRTELRLYDHFEYQDDPSIDENGATVRDNQSYILNRAELGVRQDLSRQTYADLMGAYRMKAYDDSDVAQQSDEDMAEGRLLLWRQVTPSLALHGAGSVLMYGYEDVTVTPEERAALAEQGVFTSESLERDFDILMGVVGAEQVFSPEFRAGLEGGVQAVEYASDTMDSEVFPYAKVDLTVSPTPANRIKAEVTHGVRDSDVYPFASQEFTELRAGIEIDANALLTLGLNGTVRESTYDEGALPAEVPAALEDEASGDETTTVVEGNAGWKLNDISKLVFRQRYEDVDSDVDESFTKNTSILELHLDL